MPYYDRVVSDNTWKPIFMNFLMKFELIISSYFTDSFISERNDFEFTANKIVVIFGVSFSQKL